MPFWLKQGTGRDSKTRRHYCVYSTQKQKVFILGKQRDKGVPPNNENAYMKLNLRVT